MSSAAQIAANQKNAQLSSGPTSPAGKAKSSLNAVKSGLTGRTVLLPSEDAALYEAHLAGFVKHYAPVGDEESKLVQSLADTEWRLLRIPSLEMGVYAIGRLEFAGFFPDQDEAVRKHLIEAQVFLAYQRQLNNLSIQESRLRRQCEKDTAALRELQEKRRQQTEARLDAAVRQYIRFTKENPQTEFNPAQFGFDFSLAEIQTRAHELNRTGKLAHAA